MSTRAARAGRGTLFAAIATMTAATAHTLGGSAAPSPLFCAILFVLAAPVATALVSHRPTPWRTALAVSAGQLLFHGAFAVMGDIGAAPTAGPAMAGHAHGPAIAWTMDATAAASVDMTLAHALAAIVTIALVYRGEALLSRIAAWFVAHASVPLPRPPAPASLRRVDALPARPRAVMALPPGLGRRGPPLLLLSSLAA